MRRTTVMKRKLGFSVLLGLGVLGGTQTAIATDSAAELNSCCTPADKDFPKVAGNLGNQGYSSLTQINKDNIIKLGPVWLNHFFFQAEDGIRDLTVTGVQTCALPI